MPLMWPSHGPILRAIPLAVLAFFLEGCDDQTPRHSVGYWRQKPNFLLKYSFLNETQRGALTDYSAPLNSCMSGVAAGYQCSGHGKCAYWRGGVASNGAPDPEGIQFCECFQNWAGPECNVPRKSQQTAFLLALVFGIFGVDKFYLNWIWFGLLKLLTLGGFGIWYLFDLVQYATGPPYTCAGFKTASDLPKWAGMIVLIAALMIFAFGYGVWTILRNRIKRDREAMAITSETFIQRDLKAKQSLNESLARFATSYADQDASEDQAFAEVQPQQQQPLWQGYGGTVA